MSLLRKMPALGLPIIMVLTVLSAGQASTGDREPLDWYREAKFGMFIHWGPYSVASVEASWPIMVPDAKLWGGITESEYVALPGRFNPVHFDAGDLVRLAQSHRPALHGLHHQAPRRLLHVRFVLHGLQDHQHAVPQGHRGATGGGVPTRKTCRSAFTTRRRICIIRIIATPPSW